MATAWRSMLPIAALALGPPLLAQAVDLAAYAPSGSAGFGRTSLQLPGTGSDFLVWDNGPYVTQTGVGFGGADVSELEPGLTLYGLGHQFTLGNRVADDFEVPPGQFWNLSGLRWLAYQTGAPSVGSITGIYTEYTVGRPNGSVIAGDATTNRLVSQTWTGVYRVSSTYLISSERALIEVTASIPPELGPLGASVYWIRVTCDGSASFTGPWCPPTVPWDPGDNAHQEIGPGTGFVPTTQGPWGAPVDTVFWLDATTGPSPLIYCTAKVSSCGSAPTINGSASTTSYSGAGPGSYYVTCGPVPGGFDPGLFFYSTRGPLPRPVPNQFGWLCIESPTLRISPIQPAQGAPCGESYWLDFGAWLQSQTLDPNLLPTNLPSQVEMQAWYRDPPNPGTANLSNAMSFDVLP